MAWSRKKVDSATINDGNEYVKGSRVSRQNLNAMVNSGLYAQDFAEKLVTNIDTSEIGGTGTPSVTLIAGDGATAEKPYKKFKFSNLKGEKGDKGDTGSQGIQGVKGDIGATPNISVAATTLAAGSQATATRSGTDESPIITFGIPKGDTGEKGDKGESGAGLKTIQSTLATLYSTFSTLGGSSKVDGISFGVTGSTGISINLSNGHRWRIAPSGITVASVTDSGYVFSLANFSYFKLTSCNFSFSPSVIKFSNTEGKNSNLFEFDSAGTIKFSTNFIKVPPSTSNNLDYYFFDNIVISDSETIANCPVLIHYSD